MSTGPKRRDELKTKYSVVHRIDCLCPRNHLNFEASIPLVVLLMDARMIVYCIFNKHLLGLLDPEKELKYTVVSQHWGPLNHAVLTMISNKPNIFRVPYGENPGYDGLSIHT